ncbi:MAG: sulfatase-like hydrolase/transferase [Planctomycetota bacterium]
MRPICLVAVLMALVSPLAIAQDDRPPNFVLILSDDAGYRDLGFNRLDGFPTPRIDSIARSGARFTNAYVTASVCSPSRAGLLTGRYQQRFGHEFNLGGSDESAGLGMSPEEDTIADLMRSAGYATGIIGKWHLGKADGLRPRDRGFDVFDGILEGSRSYFATDSTRSPLRVNGEPIPEPEDLYLTDWLGERAEVFLEDHAEQPFFLFLSYTAPHGPMHATGADFDAVADWVPEGSPDKRRTYAAMVRALDRSVGGVLDRIESLGLAGNTVVIFTNDNGGATDNGSDNGPLRGMKGSKWEGGVRVPMAINWPGVTAAGSRIDEPVSTLDLSATMAATARARVAADRPLDGADLRLLLAGDIGELQPRALYWRRGGAAAVRFGDWKLIRSEGNPPLLFDLNASDDERVDLSNQYPGLVHQLLGMLGAWEGGLAEPLWIEGEPWETNQRMKHRMEVETRGEERRFP